MAELILTDEERAAHTWFELPDDVVGKVCKQNGAYAADAAEQRGVTLNVGCAYLLIGSVIDHKADKLRLKVGEHSVDGEPTGDWEVIVRRVKSRRPRKET